MGLFSWLAAQFSRTTAVSTVSEVATPALYFQHTRIGGALTPEDVSSIMRERDTGYMHRFVDLVSEARAKDGHLECVLETRELAAAAMDWVITPASDKRQDKKIAEWCREWLTAFGTSIHDPKEEEPRDLRTLIAHLTGSGNLYGYGVAETLFEKDGSYVVPVGCNPIHPRRFVYRMSDGRLCFWDMFGKVPYPGTDLAAEYPGRFVQHRPRLNGDTSAREGYAAPLMWAALFRNWDISDWLKLAEIAWKPWRIGTYKQGAGKEGIAALVNAMQSLTTNGVAWMPDSVSMEVAWPRQRASSSHADLAAFMAGEMSKCVLGATLTVEQGSVGSHALGKVHNEVRLDRRQSDGWSASASIRRSLIGPAVRLNFGKEAKVPGFELQVPKVIPFGELALGVYNLYNAGLAMDACEVRALASFNDPKPGAELVGDNAPEPAMPGPKKPAALPSPPNDKPADKPAKKVA